MNDRQERARQSDRQPWFTRYWPIIAFFVVQSVALIGGAVTVKGDVERLNETTKTFETKLESGMISVTEHKTIIPIIQQDIKELKDVVKQMSEKQDRQFEAIMRAVKQ